MVSCQKGPALHAYAWQIGPFFQDTLDMLFPYMQRGLNNRDNNVREEMKLLTPWSRDKMATICISFSNTFFSND